MEKQYANSSDMFQFHYVRIYLCACAYIEAKPYSIDNPILAKNVFKNALHVLCKKIN